MLFITFEDRPRPCRSISPILRKRRMVGEITYELFEEAVNKLERAVSDYFVQQRKDTATV